MTIRTIEQAIAWGANQINNPSQDWFEQCKAFVRSCYNIGSDGTPSAAEAWRRAKFRHEWTDLAPRGAIVLGTGGSDENGHGVLTVGGGFALSNDGLRHGRIDIIHYPTLWARWGIDRSGWVEDIDGQRFMVYGDQQQGGDHQQYPDPPGNPAPKDEDNMRSIQVYPGSPPAALSAVGCDRIEVVCAVDTAAEITLVDLFGGKSKPPAWAGNYGEDNRLVIGDVPNHHAAVSELPAGTRTVTLARVSGGVLTVRLWDSATES